MYFPLRGGDDKAVEVFHAVASVGVVCPVAAVYQSYVLYRHIIAIAYIYKLRAQGFKIGTLAIPLAAQPEFIPKAAGITIDCAMSGDGETVCTISVHQCCKIVDRQAFHVHWHQRIVAYVIDAF